MSVQLKFGQREVKLQISNVTVRSVSIVFKLDPNKAIYLQDEIDGEAIIPNENGEFDILSLVDGAAYIVEGEEIRDSPAQMSFPMLGTQFSRRYVNPPPGAMSSTPPSSRPTFRHARGSSLSSPSTASTSTASSPKPAQWTKTILFCEMEKGGKTTPIYQVYLRLREDLVGVQNVAKMVEEEVGVPVTLLDNKNLEIKPSSATSKGDFWKGARKISAVPSSQYQTRFKRQESNQDEPSTIMNEIKKMREDFKRQDTVKTFLEKVFQCKICTEISMPSAVCQECNKVIGCVPCAQQWKEASPLQVCPLCRSGTNYEIVPVIREIMEVIQQIEDSPLSSSVPSATAVPSSASQSASSVNVVEL